MPSEGALSRPGMRVERRPPDSMAGRRRQHEHRAPRLPKLPAQTRRPTGATTSGAAASDGHEHAGRRLSARRDAMRARTTPAEGVICPRRKRRPPSWGRPRCQLRWVGPKKRPSLQGKNEKRCRPRRANSRSAPCRAQGSHGAEVRRRTVRHIGSHGATPRLRTVRHLGSHGATPRLRTVRHL